MDDAFRLEVRDVLSLNGDLQFDLFLVRDVLEHVPLAEDFMAAVAASVVLGGHVLVALWRPPAPRSQLAATRP